MTMLLAAGSVNVTPPAGHRLDGYAVPDRIATGTADPLRLTLIWLSTPDDPGVAWLCLDAVGVHTGLARRLAEAVPGVPADRVLVCASHTHSGPSGWSGSLHPSLPAEHEPQLAERLLAAVARLSLPLVPVTPAWSTVEAHGVGANRHDPAIPHDPTAGVLALRTEAGDVAAVLLDHACHPTVLGPENKLWSADWPGATRARLHSAGVPVVGFLQGAAGDVSPRFVRRGRDLPEVSRLGGLLADAVLAGTETPLSVTTPRLNRATVRLPVRELPPHETVRHALAAAEREVSTSCGQGPRLRLAESRLEGARGQALLLDAGLPAAMKLPISVVRLGDSIAWVHLPVEPFTSVGARIREASPFRITRVIGYTDGYFGYVADRSAHESGAYEAMMSYFDADATDALVDAVVALLKGSR